MFKSPDFYAFDSTLGANCCPQTPPSEVGPLKSPHCRPHSSHCSLRPHISSSVRVGCHSADVAEVVSVNILPDHSAPGSSIESSPGQSLAVASGSILAGLSLVFLVSFPKGSPWEIPTRHDLQSQVRCAILHPLPNT